ncbi:DUF4959 domain-containing protein [Pedobacter hiemivivus]|uniref:DUF4959 domain-containing protein n=1 Tax=Pedobacter hiemivivus TaxID=2530454 RepID=A0A4U1GIL0_9SPHI|nr:DUF5000 domain-containing lipoprotein [Pedobacter hiemivivus]TCC99453.1 DUF4959 domain-containing protein [Pedobacter hiemivivus]TKC63704.1 DUF4959 domain-containing protein [Pedobacter hiemivivus]
MKNLYFIISIIIATLLYSCTKEERLDHIDANAPAPAPISNVKIKELPGAAKLSYKIPVDQNLAYVKAIYEIQPGVFREAKTSRYADTLALVGFGDTKSYEVKIYSVGKNEKESAPVIVNVSPQTPPVRSVFSTVDVESTFGGVTVTFDNATKADLAIEVMMDTTGKNTWAPVTSYYSAAVKGKFSARGLKSQEKKFAVYIRDRWSNKSDTLVKLLTPKFETQISKLSWVSMQMPLDSWRPVNSGYSVSKIWDGKWGILTGDTFATPNGSTIPSWFSIDLGKKILLSRFKEHQAPTSHLYIASAVKKFELWGSNAPNPDGSFNGWVLLGAFESYKPSGLPMGQTTAEDKNYGNFLGEDFLFEETPPAVRYLRWKTVETYSSTGQIVIAELTLFGEVQP